MAGNPQEYAAGIRQLIANAQKLSPAAERAVRELLVESDRSILARLAELDPKSYTATQLRSVLDSVDRAMTKFRVDATKKVNDLQETAANVAVKDYSATIAGGLGTGVSHGQVNANTLRVVHGYTADLISGLSADAAAKIKGAIQRAFLGGQTITDVINAVGHVLEDGKFTGVFGPVGDDAMRTAINEVLRVHSIAGQARLEELAKRHPQVKKQWKHILAAKVPRLTHILANGQIVEVDKPFLVAGEELMFPRDPAGTPKNTIYCHCLSLPFVDDEDLYANDDDRELLKSAGLSVELKQAA